MSSCSKDKYKNYIPADSKMVGKIDMEAFFEQTGVDKDKLNKDLEESTGIGLDKIKEIGLDFSKPAYIFGRSDGFSFTMGVIIKVDDRDKFKSILGGAFDKKGDGYDYHIDGESAVAINKDVLVIIGTKYGNIHDVLDKVMNKKYDGDIDDNTLFNKVKDSKSFSCLYADMSIIPPAAIDILGRKDERVRDLFKDIRKMTIGVDGTFNNGILDFEFWAKSDDSKVQEKIEKAKNFIKPVKDYGAETLPDDAIAGIATNINGAEIASYLKSVLSNLDVMKYAEDDAKMGISMLLSMLQSVNGDAVSYFKLPEDFVFTLEADRDISRDIATIIQQDSKGMVGKSIAESIDNDEENQMNNYSNRRSPSITETENGYCLDYEHWFGYNNGALYLTNNSAMAAMAYSKASNPLPSSIKSFMKTRRFVLFVNYGNALEMSTRMIGTNPVSEITSKIKFVTFSVK